MKNEFYKILQKTRIRYPIIKLNKTNLNIK